MKEAHITFVFGIVFTGYLLVTGQFMRAFYVFLGMCILAVIYVGLKKLFDLLFG